MKINTSVLFFILLCTGSLFSQYLDQQKVIRPNEVKECRIYKRIFKNGKPTRDSFLTNTYYYNPQGRITRNVSFDSTNKIAWRSEFQYADDTLLMKMTTYRNDSVYMEDEYKYDAQGKNLELVSRPGPFFSTKRRMITISSTYDARNRLSEVYHDSGSGKKLATRYEYTTEGKTYKWNSYLSGNDKKPFMKEAEYDEKGRVSKYYVVRGKKRKFAGSNTYNEAGQRLTNLDIYQSRRTKYFGVIPYRTKKTHEILTRYSYDEKGLLTKEEKYNNGKLYYECFYQYVW